MVNYGGVQTNLSKILVVKLKGQNLKIIYKREQWLSAFSTAASLRCFYSDLVPYNKYLFKAAGV